MAAEGGNRAVRGELKITQIGFSAFEGALLMVEESREIPKGAVPLAAAIGALRDELMYAVWAAQFPYEVNGRQRWLRFKPSAVDLTLELAVTTTGTAKAGMKWWLIEAGGELAREKAATQTVKLTLEPVLLDNTGAQVELLIDTAYDTGSGAYSWRLTGRR